MAHVVRVAAWPRLCGVAGARLAVCFLAALLAACAAFLVCFFALAAALFCAPFFAAAFGFFAARLPFFAAAFFAFLDAAFFACTTSSTQAVPRPGFSPERHTRACTRRPYSFSE